MQLPLASIERIMRHAGAENTSADAIELLRASTQELAEELAADAVRIAQQDGRQTIAITDIEDAIEA
jgi:histone H3/H4